MTRSAVAVALIAAIIALLAGCGPGAPVADFTATPLTAYAPELVQFTDLSQGNVTFWAWDFDSDGVIDSTAQNPAHVYPAPGNFTVTLTTTGAGGNNTLVRAAYIRLEPCPRFADFAADPTSMNGRKPIQFTDLSAGNVTIWAWDFTSDGKIDSEEQNPQYTYTRSGV